MKEGGAAGSGPGASTTDGGPSASIDGATPSGADSAAGVTDSGALNDGGCPVNAYCTSFESDPASDGWMQAMDRMLPNGGSASEPTATLLWDSPGASSSHALTVGLAADKDHYVGAYWVRTIATTPAPYRVTFDLYFEGAATTSDGTIGAAPAIATMRVAPKASGSLTSIDLALNAGEIVLRTFVENANTPNQYVPFAGAPKVVPGAWHRISLDVDKLAAPILTVDGKRFDATSTLDSALWSFGTGLAELTLGVEYCERPTAALSERFDNLVVERR